MFSNIGWGEFLVLIVAALVILGPERLPQAIRWSTDALRKVRDFASDAKEKFEDELGDDIEEFRKPLAELGELRGMTPQALVAKHLLEGGDAGARAGSASGRGGDAGAATGGAAVSGEVPSAGTSGMPPGAGGAPGAGAADSGAAGSRARHQPGSATPPVPPAPTETVWDEDAT